MRAGDEELLRGTAVNADPALTALVAMLRESAEAPGPQPTDALATLLRTGRAPGAVAPRPVAASTVVPLAVRLRRLTSRAAALGLAAKIALTAGVAVASVGTAAAVGALPAGVQERASETLGHVVAVLAPGHERDTDDGSPVAPTQSPSGVAAVPGAAGSVSPRPTQHASPTGLPTSAETRGEAHKDLPDAATSNRAVPAQGTGSADSGDSTAPGPSSAQAQDAHAADRAADPSPSAGTSNGNDATDREATASATPAPTPSPEPTRSAGRG